MKIELRPGEKVTVTFEGTDGEIEVSFGEDRVTVFADMADSTGREGVIYEERFGDNVDPDEAPVPEDAYFVQIRQQLTDEVRWLSVDRFRFETLRLIDSERRLHTRGLTRDEANILRSTWRDYPAISDFDLGVFLGDEKIPSERILCITL